jgi:hypothetical protein
MCSGKCWLRVGCMGASAGVFTLNGGAISTPMLNHRGMALVANTRRYLNIRRNSRARDRTGRRSRLGLVM